MRHFARYVILAPLMTAFAGPSVAQTVPPGWSCGGLFCDIGMFGHKVPAAGEAAPVGVPAATAGGPTTSVPGPTVAAVEGPDPHRLPCRDFLCHAFGQQYAEEAAPAPAAPPLAEALPPEQPAKHARKMKRKHLAKAETTPPTQ